MKVAVGSKNPAKIESVRQAFESVWSEKEWEFIGIDVTSDVSNQPMDDHETIKGARTRAKKALNFGADFAVGLEGGLHKIGDEWFEAGWIVVLDKDYKEGIGSSIRMKLPQKAIDLIFSGKELGEVTDILFNKTNSKHSHGYFGSMTKNNITRITGYRDGVISALGRFINPNLFED